MKSNLGLYGAFLINLFFPLPGGARGNTQETKSDRVRILSWWGYIDSQDKKISAIEKSCGARLSVDEFYSTTEFLQRAGRRSADVSSYDILIYSDTAYNSKQVRERRNRQARIELKPSTYSPSIREFYQKKKYDAATGVFQISLSGFLVNLDHLKISGTDSLEEILRNTRDNMTVLMDDHMEIATLLNKWECGEDKNGCTKKSTQLLFPSEDKLKKLVGKSKVVISSDLADITQHPKFALAYTWSGDAIQKQSAQKNLEFVLHPSLSHSSMDLLTLVGTSKQARCVAQALTSKEFLDSVAQKSKYFSPYGPVPTQDKAFANIQTEFFKSFSTLGRIHRVTREESQEIDKKWQLFKIMFGSKI